MGVQILETLRTLGVSVTLIGPDRLRLQPASVIPPELMERVRQAKPEIIRSLTAHSATCAHCSGAGECDCPACTLRRTDTAVPCLMCRSAERQAWLAATRPEGCWHCSGAGRCTCITCAEGLLGGEYGECAACHGSGKVMAWVQ